MGAPDLLRQLHGAGFTLTLANGGGIRITPAGALTDEHRHAIRTHKPALIALLTKPTPIIAAPVMPLLSGVTGAAVSDAWCWPHSEAMNSAEIATFTERVDHSIRRGMTEAQAEALADDMVQRDRHPDDWRETFEERAAIMEFDGGLPRAGAEAAARQCVDCAHLTRRRTCLEPEAAGLIPAGQGFGIAWPPEGHGDGCAAFSSKAPRTAVAGFNRSTTR